MKPADYMRICFAMLESADVVLFQSGWAASRGVRLEYDYARYIGKNIVATDSSARNIPEDVLRAVVSMEHWMRNKESAHG